eukprot:TRINITY_DN4560_c5_g1_i3.p1 TRINITY_DN4560_c5_g1~~TRINITY_DN4560_c5_g1_i3.p1  ORF type:complete len:492 (-),score=139.43 TRINITY_DN4560_c5_g1_i3:19-1494(-)
MPPMAPKKVRKKKVRKAKKVEEEPVDDIGGRAEYSLELHKAAWKGDHDVLKGLLDASTPDHCLKYLNELDHHGHAPLHIAGHFGDFEAIKLLVDAGANPEQLSIPGWRCIEETTASGRLDIARYLLTAGHDYYIKEMEKNAIRWHKNLKDIPDFYMELQWDFSTWVPLVSSFCPRDTYKIWKTGSAMRLDYTLLGFKNFRIQRGNVSFVFTGEDQPNPGHLYVLNHDNKTRQDFSEPPGEHYQEHLDSALHYMGGHDCCSHLGKRGKAVEFLPASGWLSNAQNKSKVGDYHALEYKTKGLTFRSLIRSDPKAKKTRVPRTWESVKAAEEEPAYRARFDDYFATNPKNEEDYLNGFVWKSENVRTDKKKFKGSICLSEEYPLTVKQLMSILEIYSPTSQVWKKLEEFLTMKLPPGFPVKSDIPVFFTIHAVVQFKNFRHESFPPDMFTVPEEYERIAEAFTGQETREMFKVVKSKSGKEKDKSEGGESTSVE